MTASSIAMLAQDMAPATDLALRVAVGALLVPHGLRMTLGYFKNTGGPNDSLASTIKSLDAWGYRPGWLWAPLIASTHLICGPLLVVGLATRYAALQAAVFLTVACFERWRVGGWFWNKLGMEYTVLWAIAAWHVAMHGGGPWSLDRLLGWWL